MVKKTIIFVYFLCDFLIPFTFGRLKDLPPYFPHCYIDDPEIDDCLLKATETVRPYLLKGVPELNLPPIKELFIPKLSLEQGTDAINFKNVLTNTIITGLGDYKFTYFKFDVPNLVFTGEVLINNVRLRSDYSISGKILSIPLEGQGNITGTVGASNGTLFAKYSLKTVHGEEYLKIEKQEIKLNVGPVTASNWTGLFQDNEVFAKAVDKVLKDNTEEFVRAATPALESAMSELMKKIYENSFLRIPFKKLFPRRNN